MFQKSIFSIFAIGSLFAVSAMADDDRIWEFRASIGIRNAPSVKLTTQAQDLSPFGDVFDPSFVLPDPTGIGDATVVDSRVYDDGFVGLSRLGSMPITTPSLPITTYWGYQNASQIQGDSIYYRATGPEHRTLAGESNVSPGSFYDSDSDKTRILFPLLELSRLWWDEDDDSKKYGLTMGIYWFSQTERSPLTEIGRYTQDIAYVRKVVTDRYLHGGIVVPTAPYSGPEAPPGPIIDNIPVSRSITEETGAAETRVIVEMAQSELKMNLQSFSIGGTWRKRKQDDSLSLQLDGGLALYRAQIRLNESSTVTSNVAPPMAFSDSFRDVKYRVGFYAAAGFSYLIGEDPDIAINFRARYDGVNQIHLQSTNTTAQIDLSGWSLLLGLELKF